MQHAPIHNSDISKSCIPHNKEIRLRYRFMVINCVEVLSHLRYISQYETLSMWHLLYTVQPTQFKLSGTYQICLLFSALNELLPVSFKRVFGDTV